MKMLVETNNFLLVIIHSYCGGKTEKLHLDVFYRDQELKRLSFKLDEAQEVTYSAFLS